VRGNSGAGTGCASLLSAAARACGAMSQGIGVVSQSADSASTFLCATRDNFREEKTGALEYEKLRIAFVTAHNGTIAVSKLSDCSIQTFMLIYADHAEQCLIVINSYSNTSLLH
jgi:hypothetical protein